MNERQKPDYGTQGIRTKRRRTGDTKRRAKPATVAQQTPRRDKRGSIDRGRTDPTMPTGKNSTAREVSTTNTRQLRTKHRDRTSGPEHSRAETSEERNAGTKHRDKRQTERRTT